MTDERVYTLRELVSLRVTDVYTASLPTLRVYDSPPVQGISEPYLILRYLDFSRRKVRKNRYREVHQFELRAHLDGTEMPRQTQNHDEARRLLGIALSEIPVPIDGTNRIVRPLDGVTFRETDGVLLALVDYALEYEQEMTATTMASVDVGVETKEG